MRKRYTVDSSRLTLVGNLVGVVVGGEEGVVGVGDEDTEVLGVGGGVGGPVEEDRVVVVEGLASDGVGDNVDG